MPAHSGGDLSPQLFFSSARAHAAFLSAVSFETVFLREVFSHAFDTAWQRSFASLLQLVAWHTAPAHKSQSHRSLYVSGLMATELDNHAAATKESTMGSALYLAHADDRKVVLQLRSP